MKARTREFLFILIAASVLVSRVASAACIGPAGNEGDITYNTTHHMMQFCDATNWIAMAGADGGGGGTTPDYTSGLIGHWKLDETSGATAVNAASPGTYDGTYTNMTVSSATRPGKDGTSILFDHNDDYIAVADAPALRLTSFTMAAWVYDQGNGVYGYIMEKSGVGGTPDNYFLYRTPDGRFVCGFHDGSDWRGIDTPEWSIGSAWAHIACTYDATSTPPELALHFNATHGRGYLAASNVNAATPQTGSQPLWIGRSRFNSDSTMDGRLDDVRLYNRALSEADVRALYLATGGT